MADPTARPLTPTLSCLLRKLSLRAHNAYAVTKIWNKAGGGPVKDPSPFGLIEKPLHMFALYRDRSLFSPIIVRVFHVGTEPVINNHLSFSCRGANFRLICWPLQGLLRCALTGSPWLPFRLGVSTHAGHQGRTNKYI